MKKQRYNFNLIEIVLTVAVISFGVVVILGMLPKGLRAARNTATVSYASEVMEQMGYYIQNQNLANLPSDFADVADSADVKAKYMSSRYHQKKEVLMLNFIVIVEDKTIKLKADEIAEARWCTPEEALQLIRKGTTAEFFLSNAVRELKKKI